MSEALAVTLYFFEGRYHGAGTWPPEPARLFQAFVSGAARAETLPIAATEALRWLESQSAPVIAAPPARKSQAVTRWVPNNDVDAKLNGTHGGYDQAVAKVRVAKQDRPWLFDAMVPLVYVWDIESNPPEGLFPVVEDLYRLGRGIDPAFASAEILRSEECAERLEAHPGVLFRPGPGSDSTVPCSGTLSSLARRHMAFGRRFTSEKGGLAFRQPPKPRILLLSYAPTPRRLLYHIRSLKPEDNGGFRPIPLTRAAALVDLVLQQTTEKLAQSLPECAAKVEHLLLGKGKVRPKSNMRMRVIPLPSSGHPEVDPSVRRLLLDVPPSCPIAIDDLDWAFTMLHPKDPSTGKLFDWKLERVNGHDKVNKHLLSASRTWQTLTPVLVPGYRRSRTGAERRNATETSAHNIRQALRHAGVLQKPTEIRLQPEPFHRRGSRAEKFELPAHMRASPISAKQLVHVKIRFCEPVEGPLLIGDGRFRGLGLMEPVRDRQDVWLFSVMGSSTPIAPEALARAARRAVMSRVASEMGTRNLPQFFTGHDADGTPVRRGARVHIGFLIDPDQRYLLIATPQALNHTEPDVEQIAHTSTLDRAVSGLKRIVAGTHGVFDLCSVSVDGSALMHASKVWESITDWQPDRYGKGDPAGWVPADVRRACTDRGLPLPTGY